MISHSPQADDPLYAPDLIGVYAAVDRSLARAASLIRTIEWITPSNAAEERERFLVNPTLEPLFTYSPRSEEEKASLLALIGENEIPSIEPTLHGLFEERKNELSLESALIDARGDRAEMTRLSQTIYGVPSPSLLTIAEAILTETPESSPFTLSSQEIYALFDDALHQLGLSDWKVSYWENRTTMVRQETKEILLSKERTFRANDGARLVVHEIGVHATRAANGYRQPFTIFALGLPGYLATEEGLASYAEQVCGYSDIDTLRTYAARVIAVDALVSGASFVETAERLRSHNLSLSESFDVTLRVFRGGGFTKDYLYLKGLSDVRAYVERGGDVEELLIGKIAIEHLPLVSSLLSKGVLKAPQCRGYLTL